MNQIYIGEEVYAMKKAIRMHAKQLVDVEDEFSYVILDYPSVLTLGILEEAQTISMFSTKKVIVIENCTFLSTSSVKDPNIDELLLYLKQSDEDVSLFFVCPFASMDNRKKIVKELKKVCKVYTYNVLDDKTKAGYVREQAHKKGLHMSDAVLQQVIRRLPYDMYTIEQELNKLASFGDELTQEAVDHLVTRSIEDEIFTFVSTLLTGNKEKLILSFQDLLALKKDEIQLIALLASQLRFYLQVKILDDKGMYENDIASTLKAHPYRTKLSLQTARRYSYATYFYYLKELASLDQTIKTGDIDKRIGFEQFLLRPVGYKKSI